MSGNVCQCARGDADEDAEGDLKVLTPENWLSGDFFLLVLFYWRVQSSQA